VAMEGQGSVTAYPGGWSDYAAQRGAGAAEAPTRGKSAPPAAPPSAKPGSRKLEGLSFTERKRLEALPELIAKLETEISRLAALLDSEDLYSREPVKFRKASEAVADRQAQLTAAEAEWLALEDRAAG